MVDMAGKAGREAARNRHSQVLDERSNSLPSPPLPSCYSLICVRTTETAPRVRGRLAVFLEKETEGVDGEERNCLLYLSLSLPANSSSTARCAFFASDISWLGLAHGFFHMPCLFLHISPCFLFGRAALAQQPLGESSLIRS
jgi:hypothetical protein